MSQELEIRDIKTIQIKSLVKSALIIPLIYFGIIYTLKAYDYGYELGRRISSEAIGQLAAWKLGNLELQTGRGKGGDPILRQADNLTREQAIMALAYYKQAYDLKEAALKDAFNELAPFVVGKVESKSR